jgi:hypothetical protein
LAGDSQVAWELQKIISEKRRVFHTYGIIDLGEEKTYRDRKTYSQHT